MQSFIFEMSFPMQNREPTQKEGEEANSEQQQTEENHQLLSNQQRIQLHKDRVTTEPCKVGGTILLKP